MIGQVTASGKQQSAISFDIPVDKNPISLYRIPTKFDSTMCPYTLKAIG